MELKENFTFTLSNELKFLAPISDYEAIKRKGTNFYEVWWVAEDGVDDYVIYDDKTVFESISKGEWIITNNKI